MNTLKKDTVLTVRVDSDVDEAIRALAKEDDRTIAYMTRKLLEEALIARGCLKLKKQKD